MLIIQVSLQLLAAEMVSTAMNFIETLSMPPLKKGFDIYIDLYLKIIEKYDFLPFAHIWALISFNLLMQTLVDGKHLFHYAITNYFSLCFIPFWCTARTALS